MSGTRKEAEKMPRSRPWLAALSVIAILFGLTAGPLLGDARAQEEPVELRVWDQFTEGSASPTVEAVYAAFLGPSYETPAEVRMARALGAGLVGMSTVLEAIAARQLGAEVLGLSLVTNPAAGVVAEPIDHADVLAQGRAAADDLGRLLAAVVAASEDPAPS